MQEKTPGGVGDRLTGMNRRTGAALLAAAGAWAVGGCGGTGPEAALPVVALSAGTVPAAPDGGAATPAGVFRRPAPGRIETVAASRPVPDGADALEVAFYGVAGLAVDPETGALYVSDRARSTIFRVDPDGRVHPFAGTEIAGFGADYRPALESRFHLPSALAVAPIGRELLVADSHNRRIRIVSSEGLWVSTLAGLGVRGTPPDQVPTAFPALEMLRPDGSSGDGGPAVESELGLPSGVAMDRRGIVFVADSANHRVRAVNRRPQPTVVAGVEITGGHIATIAGTGVPGFAGDGGSALAARLAYPTELAVDGDGDLWIVDTFNHRLRRLDRETGQIDTVAVGGPAADPSAGAVPGWQVSIAGVAVDATGDVVYSDRLAGTVYRLRPGGAPEKPPEPLWSAPAGEAALGSVAAGPGGEVYVADLYNNRVLRLADGEAATYAGGAAAGDGVPLQEAAFSSLDAIAVDPRGDLYLADAFHYSVRRIRAADGVVETFLGSGRIGTAGDGGPPSEARLVGVSDLLVEPDGSVLVADPHGRALRRVRTTRGGPRVDTVTAGGAARSGANGEAAGAPRLGAPLAVARHPRTGAIFVACQETHSVYELAGDGRPVVIAGRGVAGFAGDGGPSRAAALHRPAALAFDRDGVLYVADMLNHRVRRIMPDGLIDTFAGTGERGDGGDGGPARAARLAFPSDLAVDPDGGLLVADTHNHRIRHISADPPHRIDTFAGTGLRGFSGDGGPAREARLNLPRGLALGADGTLYFIDGLNRRVRAVRPVP
jgi:sugar lactone lactonase YvrE